MQYIRVREAADPSIIYPVDLLQALNAIFGEDGYAHRRIITKASWAKFERNQVQLAGNAYGLSVAPSPVAAGVR
jgi:hypothetical protein